MVKDKQFAVLGLGRFGQCVAKTLSDNGYNVMACDLNPEIVHEVSAYVTHAVQLDVTDEMAIEELGIRNFDVVIIAIAADFEASMMATMMVKEKGAQYILAKATNQRQRKMLEAIGADRVVLPEREMGVRIAMNLITTNVIDFINISDEYGIAEIDIMKEWHGKTLQKANVRSEYGLNIVAIKRNKNIIVSPKATELILKDDVLVVIGENSDIQRLSRKSREGGAFGGLFDRE